MKAEVPCSLPFDPLKKPLSFFFFQLVILKFTCISSNTMLVSLRLESSVLGTKASLHGRWTFSSVSTRLQHLHHPPLQRTCTLPISVSFPIQLPCNFGELSIYIELLGAHKFYSLLRHMVYHDCFSLLAHLFVSLELKFPQDSKTPKEETAATGVATGLAVMVNDNVCELWQLLLPCTYFSHIQEYGCVSTFTFQISHKLSLWPTLIWNHSGRQFCGGR